jgi:5-formyltetrahydrofolate cyclo-ligase
MTSFLCRLRRVYPARPETMIDPQADLRQQKKAIRAAAAARREQQENKDELSRQIGEKLASLREYAAAVTAMFYLDFGSEVRTRPLLPILWQQAKQVVIPYCVADRLELFLLQNVDDLAPGAWGILEPKPELRERPDRKIAASQLDLIVTPGVAFDRQGGRVGYGKGFYDKLLATISPHTRVVAICFECQLFPQVPMAPYDVPMEKVITETAIYERCERVDVR